MAVINSLGIVGIIDNTSDKYARVQSVLNKNSDIPLTKQTNTILKVAILEAKKYKSPIIQTEHVMLAILRSKENIVSQVFRDYDIDDKVFRDHYETTLNFAPKSHFENDDVDFFKKTNL